MRWSFRTNGNFIDFVHTDETSLAIESTVFHLHNTSKCIDWSLPSDTTRINFTIDETKYSNILITDIDFDGTVMNSQDDFETGIEAMFPGLAGGGDGIESVVAGSGISVDASDPANPVVSATGGAGIVLSATVELTDAQIKALPTTSIQLAAAPGANKIIRAVNIFFRGITTDVYGNVGDSTLNFYLDNPAGVFIGTATTTFLEEAPGDYINSAVIDENNSVETSLAVNKGLYISSPNVGNFTGGNAANTLKVTVYYVVVDL